MSAKIERRGDHLCTVYTFPASRGARGEVKLYRTPQGVLWRPFEGNTAFGLRPTHGYVHLYPANLDPLSLAFPGLDLSTVRL